MSLLTSSRRDKPAPEPGLMGPLDQVRQRVPRKAGQLAASILFVVLVVVGLVALFQSQSDRVEVLVVKKPVPAGQLIASSDVGPAQVAGVDGAIEAADVESVVGLRAAGDLVEGQILTRSAVTDALVPAEGERLVALRLDGGRVPGNLAEGDRVDVIVVPPEGDAGVEDQLTTPVVLAKAAKVQSLGETVDSAVVVTVLVDAADGDSVAAYSAAGRITIVQAPVGE